MNAAIIKRSAQDKTIKFVLFNFQVLQNPPRSAMPVCGCRYAARRKSYWNGVDNCFLCKKARYLGSGLFKFKRKASSSVGGSSDRRGKNGIITGKVRIRKTTLIIIFKILQDLIPHYIYYIYAVNKSFHQYAIREKTSVLFMCMEMCCQ